MNYQQAMAYLDHLQRFGIHLGLENISRLLAVLDNPHHHFKSVLIGGTNGKGSTAAFVSSILTKAGLKVGLYTSPHLLSFTERIAINQQPISEERVAELMTQIAPLIDKHWPNKGEGKHSPTYFEVATALAFCYFAQEGIDLAVLEVGLGGRMDATNVVSPLVTCITNVTLEHVGLLGETLTEIAYEKAGIIKPGISVVTAAKEEEALEVIELVSRQNGAQLYQIDKEIRFEVQGDRTPDRLTISTPTNIYPEIQLNLLGHHQIVNAATAVGIVVLLRYPQISLEHVREGLSEVRWPGRMDVISQKPLVILDVAHNPDGAKALRQAISDYFPGYELVFVLGVLQDKDIGLIVDELLADNEALYRVIVTQPQTSRALASSAIAEVVTRYTNNVSIEPTVAQAINAAQKLASASSLICITGSLYTVAEAMEYYANRTTRTS